MEIPISIRLCLYIVSGPCGVCFSIWVRSWRWVSLNSLRPSEAYMPQWINHHWFRQWLVARPAPSYYLNQCWNIANWILSNKFQWNINPNSDIFIQENTFDNVIRLMAAILSRLQCVNCYLVLLSFDIKPSYQFRNFTINIRQSHDNPIFMIGIPLIRLSLYWNDAMISILP